MNNEQHEWYWKGYNDAKKSLAQPAVPQGHEQDPVAWMDDEMNCIFFDAERPEPFDFDFWEPLYTTLPQRKPLTDIKRDSMVDRYDFGLMEKFWYLKGIDDTEAAHGIKE